eukprot:5443738-Amphidinium_carterae.1
MEEVEDLSHVMFSCPHWHKERCQVELPTDDDTVPACVQLHGLQPAPLATCVGYRAGVTTVWTDGSGHGYCGELQHRLHGHPKIIWLPVPGIKQSCWDCDDRLLERDSIQLAAVARAALLKDSMCVHEKNTRERMHLVRNAVSQTSKTAKHIWDNTLSNV